MAGIPPLALERLAKLRRMLDAARAQGEGLQSRVDEARRALEHAQLGLTMSIQSTGESVIVGEGGQAYARRLRERTRDGDGPATAYVLDVDGNTLVRAPKHDAVTQPVFDAKARLAEAMASRREALEKAASLRTAVDGVEQALRARGWREGLPTGEGLLRDPNAGPTVANAVRSPEQPNMFQNARAR